MDTLWRILATLGLVVLNGYFVAAEFAAVSARTSRLEQAAQSSLLARMALDMMGAHRPEPHATSNSAQNAQSVR